MARIHGRSGVIYAGQNSGDAASPVAFLSGWSINFTPLRGEITGPGDANRSYISGLTDVSGDFTGFYDTATAQTYVAAIDGLPRNFCLYPSATDSSFFTGLALLDYSVTAAIGAAAAVKGTFSAAGPFGKAASGSSGLYSDTYSDIY